MQTGGPAKLSKLKARSLNLTRIYLYCFKLFIHNGIYIFRCAKFFACTTLESYFNVLVQCVPQNYKFNVLKLRLEATSLKSANFWGKVKFSYKISICATKNATEVRSFVLSYHKCNLDNLGSFYSPVSRIIWIINYSTLFVLLKVCSVY